MPDGLLPRLRSLADQYLSRLACDGIPVPALGAGRADIDLNEYDRAGARAWVKSQTDDKNRIWVAFGPGSNMASKKWPVNRFAAVGKSLIASHDIWPIVFGGKEDQPIGNHLVTEWKRGWVAAGGLPVRHSAAALEQCVLYVGNDTGTMHLAASAGAPCVAVFSALDYPGLWEPYGNRHIILRHDPPCCGCTLTECLVPGHPCLSLITDAEVTRACRKILCTQTRSIGAHEQ